VVYNLIFVIGRSVFWKLDELLGDGWLALDYVSDALYVVDSIIRMHEGYLEHGLMVTDAKKLRSNYRKSKFMLLDALSLFPTDLAYLYYPNTCAQTLPCRVIFRLNR